MMNISRKFFLTLACTSPLVFLTGCGGSPNSSSLVPATLDGYVVQLTTGPATTGMSPGTIVAYPTTSQSALDGGTVLSAQIAYSPVAGTDNQARITVSTHTPENTSNPTTVTYSLAVIMQFTGDKVVGDIVSWDYHYFTTGAGSASGNGSSGTFKLFLQQR